MTLGVDKDAERKRLEAEQHVLAGALQRGGTCCISIGDSQSIILRTRMRDKGWDCKGGIMMQGAQVCCRCALAMGICMHIERL